MYKNWRHNVYARDNFTCQWPGCKNTKKLNAHHIYKWADFPGLRFHIYNGITLCKQHHDMIKNNEDNYRHFFSKIVANKCTK